MNKSMFVGTIIIIVIVSFWALVLSDIKTWFKYEEWSDHIKNEHGRGRD